MTEETSPPDIKTNFILRLWRGDVPLWKTYWVYGSLVGFILSIAVRLVLYQYYYYAEDFSTFDRYVIAYLLVAFISLYSLLISLAFGEALINTENYIHKNVDMRCWHK